MSNLSDLLPAGASAKQITATDSGSGIASKAPVVMSASGTVSAISETASGNSAATASQYDAAVLFYYGSMVYDPDTQRVVLAYIDTNNSYYASIVVGEASASGVTWGTPVTVYSGQTVNFIAACYDTTNDRVGVAYNRYGGGAWYAGYSIDGGTNAPTSIATHVQFSTGNEYYIDLAYHPGENVIVSVSTTMAYSPNRGKVSVARLGASSITLGNEEFFDTYGASVYPQAQSAFNLIYESNLAELIVNFADASNSGYMTTCVISPAGTGSATFGAYNVYVSEQSYNNTLTFDENSGKLLYTYRRSSTSPTFRGAAKVGLASGTSVTVDATENYFTSTGQAREQDAAYDATAKKIGLVYYVYSSGSETRFVDATTSASDYSVTFGTDVAAYTAVTSGAGAASLMAYDSALGKLVWAFNNSATGISQSTILTVANTTSNLTSTNLLGIASGAISDTATGTINTWGSRNEVQTGLTIGSDYYVQTDGRIEAGVTSIAFDISSATYTQNFDISSQATIPQAIAFNPTGTKMFIVDIAGQDVNEYALSTGFDVSSASYTQNFSVASQDTAPTGISFNAAGTKMFVCGYTNVKVYEYTLSSGFDLSTASYAQDLDVSGQDTLPKDVVFNTDGTKMFVLGGTGVDVNEYTLTAYDISTASFVDSFSVASQESAPDGIAFNTDGTKMFIVGNTDSVFQYNLSSGFDVSTASYASISFSVSSQETGPTGIAFSADGKKMFIVGTQGDDVNEYATTANSFSTDYLIGKAITATQINIKDYTG